jgi:CBS domain-containing protein
MSVAITGRTLALTPCSVCELMTDNPLSIPATATVREAVKFLTDHEFSAAPVINEAGHPVGVLSRTDLVNRLMRADHLRSLEEDWFECGNLVSLKTIASGEYLAKNMEYITVDEIMTPTVICIAPHDSLEIAIEQMLNHEIHRLFVVDSNGVLVGVLSSFDILRHLKG